VLCCAVLRRVALRYEVQCDAVLFGGVVRRRTVMLRECAVWYHASRCCGALPNAALPGAVLWFAFPCYGLRWCRAVYGAVPCYAV
jgi:hypothetical protein